MGPGFWMILAYSLFQEAHPALDHRRVRGPVPAQCDQRLRLRAQLGKLPRHRLESAAAYL